jgi:dihydrolipoamide dehydrogenase
MYDAIVIGGGPAGYLATVRMIRNGLKVALIEKRHLGGECTNCGCIPSKALIEASHAAQIPRLSRVAGISLELKEINQKRLMGWISRIINRSREGVKYLVSEADLYEGKARIKSVNTVVIEKDSEKKEIYGKNILVATGTEPSTIPGVDIDGEVVITNREFFELKSLPSSIVIIGAGAIGVELSGALARLGVDVTLVEILDRPLPFMDEDVSQIIEKSLKKERVKLLTSHLVKAVRREGNEALVKILPKNGGEAMEVRVEKVLVSVGRRLNTRGIGLEDVGVELGNKGVVLVNEFMRTSVANIYAAGDITGPPFLAHKAYREGLIAADSITGKAPEYPRGPIPIVVYSDPEVASVGITEVQAKERGINYKVFKFPYSAVARDYTNIRRTPDGFAKLVVGADDGKLLGAVIVGNGASELIHSLALAMSSRLSIKDIAKTVYPHPSLSEVIGEVAHLALGEALHIK